LIEESIMETGKLTVEYRTSSGKNEAKRLRASGRVPGICYGSGSTPLPISLVAKELKKALDPEKRQNTVIHVTVNGAEGGNKELTVMLRDYQTNALRGDVEHVDLVVVDLQKDIVVDVPIVLTGKAVGVVDGGQLHTEHRTLAVSCKPSDIPAKIVADITALKVGDALHVSDLQLPAGVKPKLPPGESVASVVAPKVEKVTEAAPTEAAAAEGAAKDAKAPAAGGDKAAAAKAPAAKEAKK
jgi:large subunit ribosomal protein L25